MKTPASPTWFFVLPAGSDRPSGGNVYNLALAAALARNVPFRTLTLAEWQAELRAGTPGRFLLDTLDLGQAELLDERRPGQSFGLVVHHLPSLEPDLAADDPLLTLERRALPAFDFFVCTSPFTAALLRERGFEQRRLVTLPPVAPGVSAPAKPRVYAPPLVALVVANLVPRKDVLPLLELLDAETRAEYRLVIVGRSDIDPAYADRCAGLVRGSSELSRRVRLVGAVPHAEIHAYYAECHLLLSTARMETFGMALQEARAHGLPLLVRRGGYAEEHVAHEACGSAFSSLPELVREFEALAADPGRMRVLFERAQQTAPRGDGDWDRAARTLVAFLEG